MPKRRKNSGPPPGYDRLRELPLAFSVGSFRCEMQYWGWLGEKWWRNYMHVHTFYEICYAFEGAGTFEMLGTTYQIKPGEVFVAKPREEHEIVSSRRNPLGIYFWAYTLVPPRTPAAARTAIGSQRTEGTERTEGSEGNDAIDRLLHAFIESRRWVSSDVAGMQRTLHLIVEEAAAGRPGYMSAIEGLARKLIVDTARAVVDCRLGSEQPLHRSDNPDALVVERATRYMRDNYARALAVSEVAGQVSLSERHLNRLFQKHLNKTPLDVLTTIRIEAASQLLLDRNLAIKDIAARTGYPDVRYFTTVFRQAMRVTPAVFRNKAAAGTSWVDPEHAHNRP